MKISSFNIFGLEIKLYGLIIAIGMVLGIVVAIKNSRKRNIKPDDILTLALIVLPLAVIGARIYYVVFSNTYFSFWDLFKIWEGGMAIYGGVIGGAIGVTIFCLIKKCNFFDIADIAAVSLILGQGIGRIGCYFAGCCYGIEVTNPAFMWFPFSTMIHGAWHYSTFFYESFFNLIIFAVLFILIQKKVKTRGIILSLYLISYGFVRCVIEAFRGDSLYLWNFKVSQLLSVLLMIVGIILLIVIYTKSKKVQNDNQKTNTENNITT